MTAKGDAMPSVPFAFQRLDHIQLTIPAGCEEQARQFYTGVLGLQEIEKPKALKPNGGVWFAVADIQLHIGVEQGQPPSKRHPAFEIDNLAAARTHLLARGVRVQEDTPIPGVQRFSCFDPFGNRIELMEIIGDKCQPTQGKAL